MTQQRHFKMTQTHTHSHNNLQILTVVLVIIAKNWKQAKCPSTKEWTALVHLHNGIVLSNKKEQTMPTCNNKDKSQTHHAKCKKLDGHTMYDSISVTLQRRQNYRERKHISSCQVLDMAGGGQRETSRGDGSVLQLTCGGGGYWLHAFVKFHRSIH